MSEDKVVYIDDGENADWIKTPENRQSEAEIHEQLASKLKKERDETPDAGPGVDKKRGP